MSHSLTPKRSQLPAVRRRPLPVTPPARYCPKCENTLELRPPTVYNIYNCTTCESLLFESETDEFPGQTKGKSNPHEPN